MIIVTCAIITKYDKVLAVQRNENMSMPLKWEFPGGKLEKYEDEKECIKREILEELNIQIKLGPKLSTSTYDYGNIKIQLIPFLASIESGTIKLLEHKTYRWLGKEDLLKLDWAEADVTVVNEYLKGSFN